MTLDLSAISERARRATPPPWHSEYGQERGWWLCGPEAKALGWLTKDDVDFLVNARSDVPALVEEVERLRAIVDHLDGALVEYVHDLDEKHSECARLRAALESAQHGLDTAISLFPKIEAIHEDHGDKYEYDSVCWACEGQRELQNEVSMARAALEPRP